MLDVFTRTRLQIEIIVYCLFLFFLQSLLCSMAILNKMPTYFSLITCKLTFSTQRIHCVENCRSQLLFILFPHIKISLTLSVPGSFHLLPTKFETIFLEQSLGSVLFHCPLLNLEHCFPSAIGSNFFPDLELSKLVGGRGPFL